ncbi:MAG: TerC family protein [Acidimicrobiia bacterium]|nr:TerC family protein [Acidimicrobiia bacterium]
MPIAVWIGFLVFVVAMLMVDLFAFQREAHAVDTREAAIWTGIWVTLGLSFAVVLWIWKGGDVAGQYLAGYLIEKSLSVDNIFVFAVLFGYFKVPAEYRHRVLFWGIFGALVLRFIFIFAGVALLELFHPMIFVFGAFLLWTAWKMWRHSGAEVDPSDNPVLRLTRRFVPMTTDYHGAHLFTRIDGRLMATPLFAVLLMVESTDVVFAVDSIPAVLAVTTDTFLVFTSNAFAILGLRAMYFLLEGSLDKFRHLSTGLALVLAVVGTKMLLTDIVHVPIWLSLILIGGILTVSIVASLVGETEPVEAEISHVPAAGAFSGLTRRRKRSEDADPE